MVWIVLLILVGVVLFAAVFFAGIYNQLVTVKNNANKAQNDINIGLKQRHDELPKLLEVCKGYMKYEQNLLTQITELRTKVLSAPDIKQQADLDNQLTKAVKSLFAVAENYPQLKASENFIQLQQRVSAIESVLSGYRAAYNGAANTYNITIQHIPQVFLAGPLGYRQKEMFQVAEEDKKDVEIKF